MLIVDDDENIREIAQLSLETIAGWTVSTAGSGGEGIVRARAERPDVILLDVMMPDMDGPATLEKLKADPATRDVPVVLLTATVRTDVPPSFRNLPVEGVIAKPFDPMTLADQIAHALDWTA